MKNIRTGIKKTVYIVAFLLLLTAATLFVNRLLKDKYNFLKYEEFYGEKEPFDVLFFGSSRMLDGVHPMELWEEYGMTAYNMAQHSESTRVSYWQLKNAFQHNKPRVAVVDLSLLGGTIENGYLHKSLDHMPLGKLKVDALKNISEDLDMAEFLFPITIYHNRWNQLERMDVYGDTSCRKGAESRMLVEPLEAVEWSSDGIFEATDTVGTKIDDIVALCEENGVQLVFSCMPTLEVSANPGICQIMNYFERYAKERDIPFLNFAKNDDFLNYRTDFSDVSHLNPSGAKKLTGEFGAFLTEHYRFEEKSDRTVKQWEKAEQEYRKTKQDELIAKSMEQNAASYLMLLNDDDYELEITVNDAAVIERLKIAALLEELDMTKKVTVEALEDAAMEVTVYSKDTGELFHSARIQ